MSNQLFYDEFSDPDLIRVGDDYYLTGTTMHAMHRWLENFAYQTTLNWWIFVLSGLIVFVVALLTVSWQSWRAATRNPVE